MIYSAFSVLSLIGITISVFLLIRHYYPAFGGAAFSCGAGCAQVSSSEYAAIFGTPLPVFGIYFFSAILLVEAGFLLYGKNSFVYFVALMIPAYIAAGVFCIVLGSIMISLKAFCHGCVAVYAVVFLSFAFAVLGGYRLGIKGRYRYLLSEVLSALKKHEFRPMIFFCAAALILLIPAVTYLNIFVRFNFVKTRIAADNTAKSIEEIYSAQPINLSLPESVMNSGEKNARVSIIVFTDFMCSACIANHKTISLLKKKYGNDLFIQYYNYPLDAECNSSAKFTMYKNSCVLASYMVTAAFDGIFPELDDYYYKNIDFVKKSVQRGNFSPLDEFLSARGKARRADASARAGIIIRRDAEIAASLGIHSTPVMFINGRKIEGAYHIDVIEGVITRALR